MRVEAFGLENDMSIGSEGDLPALENLSALSDGEVEPSAVTRACAAWRDDAGMRSAWHAYQLIGDVLRSEDLASPAAHDVLFIAGLRARLVDEPTVLAPDMPADTARPAAVPLRSARRAWMAPSAVAAGFVLVAGALVVTRSPAPSAPQAVASAFAVAPELPPVTGPSTLAPAEAGFVSRRWASEGKVLRDARLDRYLAAHQQFAGTTALGVPSGFLRNAAAEAPSR
jgi:sigma-E factor negative regulatory protein RseA